MSTKASAECACSPLVGVGVGLGKGAGLGVGAGAGVDAGAGSGRREGPDRRWRVDVDKEESCVFAEAAILAVAPVGVAFCTTLQPTAAIIKAIVIRR